MAKQILDDQVAYYRARAHEYDQWFLREGRYDHGEIHNAAWRGEVDDLQSELDDFAPEGDVLEIACGTGLWTARLAAHARSILAVDAAPEMIAINRERLRGRPVEYVEANVFDWTPLRTFDVVFFGFWLSHVPASRFADFWGAVAAALRPGGRVFFVDSRPHPASRAKDHEVANANDSTQVRYLNSGERFEIVKRYYNPPELEVELHALGWTAHVKTSGEFFIYGAATRRD